MAGNSEIIAILSSGISYNRMLRPYFISAVFLAILSFYLANYLIPYTNQKREPLLMFIFRICPRVRRNTFIYRSIPGLSFMWKVLTSNPKAVTALPWRNSTGTTWNINWKPTGLHGTALRITG
jgi:hypothetical protein